MDGVSSIEKRGKTTPSNDHVLICQLIRCNSSRRGFHCPFSSDDKSRCLSGFDRLGKLSEYHVLGYICVPPNLFKSPQTFQWSSSCIFGRARDKDFLHIQ